MARGRGTPEGGRRNRRGRGRAKAASSPLPFDARAQRESGEVTTEGADTRAKLQAAYAQAQSQLGLGAGAADPYGASQENKEALTNTERGIVNGAGNSLYSGATLNRARQARSTYDKTQKRLEDEFATAQGQYTGGIAGTTRDEEVGQAGIEGESIERAAATTPVPLAVGSRKGRGRLGARRPQNNRNRGRGRV